MNGELKLKWLLNCMLLCGLAATPAYSQRGVGDAEGIARQTVKPDVVSLEGTVAEIRIAKCEKTTGPSLIGAHVLVTTEDGTVLNVHLGPADAVRDVTNQLVPGQAVAIKAFRTAKLPEDNYVAQSLTIDGSSIELRDENLRPVWAGSGQVARSPGRGPGRGQGLGQGQGLGRGQGQGRDKDRDRDGDGDKDWDKDWDRDRAIVHARQGEAGPARDSAEAAGKDADPRRSQVTAQRSALRKRQGC